MIYPLEKLRQDDFEVSGFFYNPNIQPFDEFEIRKRNVFEYSHRVDCAMYYDDGYNSDEFFQSFKGEFERPQRCYNCWYLRLKKTAEHAKRINLKYFSTTLLVSPYQDQAMIRSIGNKVAHQADLEFYYHNFSSGYQYSVEVSRQEKMYRQKYCGCNQSHAEAQAARKSKKKNKIRA
jgi:predicted adenine nucleotide alpha hydrolase (AANH) superfamily ATPase